MNRRELIKSGSIMLGAVSMAGLQELYNELSSLTAGNRMPALFVGHGSPMNAIEDNQYSTAWKRIGESLPVPSAILSVSAHWITRGVTKVSTTPNPSTIHDFMGFPKELFDMVYPAPGPGDMGQFTLELLRKSHSLSSDNASAHADTQRGLDHGTWSVLAKMYPKADIPVYQLSIDYNKPPVYHFNLARQLESLRNKGVLIMGSGNIVHNLSLLRTDGKTYDWSLEFDSMVKTYIDKGDFIKVAEFQDLGELARLAHPTYDHFLPLIYVLGLAGTKEKVRYFNEGFDLGSISMRSLVISSES